MTNLEKFYKRANKLLKLYKVTLPPSHENLRWTIKMKDPLNGMIYVVNQTLYPTKNLKK